MPEGPEIRLAADEVEAAIGGKKTTEVVFSFARLNKHASALRNKRVLRVETRGKAMLTIFENNWVIYSHNQLYGRWYVCPQGQYPSTTRQLRLAIHTSDQSALLYSASDIEVLKTRELASHRFLSKLGPDILSEHPSVDTIVERLESNDFCRRQLAGLLLDQGFLAGLGNYLRAEILFVAKLHPGRRPVDCTRTERVRLAKAILKITQRAYQHRGVVVPAALVKKLKAGGKTHKEQHRFMVYGRAERPCYVCDTPIERAVLGGRALFYCPQCQS